MSKRKINIFGTTGSIGQSTLKVLRQNKVSYDFVAFSANDNVDQLIIDCLEFKPQYANIGNKRHSHPALEAVNIISKEIENIRRILNRIFTLFLLSKNIKAREKGHIRLNQAAK